MNWRAHITVDPMTDSTDRTRGDQKPFAQAPELEAGFLGADLEQVDPEVSRFVRREFVRQCDQLQLIAPKTFASRAAIQVLG